MYNARLVILTVYLILILLYIFRRDLLKEILKLTEREEEMADALKKERKAHVKAKAEWLKAVNSVEEQEKK